MVHLRYTTYNYIHKKVTFKSDSTENNFGAQKNWALFTRQVSFHICLVANFSFLGKFLATIPKTAEEMNRYVKDHDIDFISKVLLGFFDPPNVTFIFFHCTLMVLKYTGKEVDDLGLRNTSVLSLW